MSRRRRGASISQRVKPTDSRGAKLRCACCQSPCNANWEFKFTLDVEILSTGIRTHHEEHEGHEGFFFLHSLRSSQLNLLSFVQKQGSDRAKSPRRQVQNPFFLPLRLCVFARDIPISFGCGYAAPGSLWLNQFLTPGN